MQTLPDENHHITKGAGVVAFFTALSRIFGLLRDSVVFHVFGAGGVTDAFLVAFTIPNTLRRFVGEGALTVSFIPEYTEVREKYGDAAAKRFLASVFGLLMAVLGVLIAIGVVTSKFVVYLFASGFAEQPEKMELATSLTRWMFPYIFFISLVALAMGVLNTHRHFMAPAAAPVLLNLSMIVCTLFLAKYFQEPIFALALGVMLGGILQLALQIPALTKLNLLVWPSSDWNSEPIKRLFKMMAPALFGIGIYQFNIIILRQLASYLPNGQITYYYTADRLTELALGVFAFSVAVASLPVMSKQAAAGDHKGLIKTWRFSTQLTNFITIPAAFGLFAMATPIVSVLYLHGRFNWQDTQTTAHTVMAFSLGLVGIALTRSTVQAFYARKNMRTPVMIGMLTLISNLVLGYSLRHLEVVGLGLALSITNWMQAIVLMILLRRDVGRLGGRLLLKSIVRHSALAFIAALAAQFASGFFDWSQGLTVVNAAALFACIGIAIGIYGGGALLFGFEEADPVKKLLQRRFLKR